MLTSPKHHAYTDMQVIFFSKKRQEQDTLSQESRLTTSPVLSRPSLVGMALAGYFVAEIIISAPVRLSSENSVYRRFLSKFTQGAIHILRQVVVR